MTITQIHETGAPRLPFSCILMLADDWKLSGSLEALPHLSTWGGGLPVLDPVQYIPIVFGRRHVKLSNPPLPLSSFSELLSVHKFCFS